MAMHNDQAKKYSRVLRTLAEIRVALIIMLLYVLGMFHSNRDLNRLIPPLNDHPFVAFLVYGVLIFSGIHFLSLPFAAATLVTSRRHGMSKQTFPSWFRDYFKQASLSLLVSTAAVACLYGTLRYSRDYWWLLYWAGMVSYRLVLVLLLPSVVIPFFYKLSPLPAGATADSLGALVNRLRVPSCKFEIIHVATKTRAANALVAGVGTSARILLTDTLVSDFSPAEIEALAAHELGHYVYGHVAKRLLALSALYLAGLALTQWLISVLAVNPLVPGDLPYVIIGFIVLMTYIKVILAGLTRRQELAADRYAWDSIADIGAYIAAMKKLAVQNLIVADRQRQWAYSHPALDLRIMEAEKVMAQRRPPQTNVVAITEP